MDVTTSSHICHFCGAFNEGTEQECFACQHPLTQHSVDNEPLFILDERYHVVSLLGSGGFSAVYKALDSHNYNTPVAIKQITLKDLSTQEIIDATDTFNREAQLLSTLHHPQLPRVLDRFSDAEHWYLVIDFLAGETLETYLQAHTPVGGASAGLLPLSEVLDIALQLCNVLHYLHTQEPAIIFRDLKPGNIMRNPDGQLSLIDFGIARQFKPGKAKDTIPLGSPGYAAPEQYGKRQTTPQADIYSLGVLLHFLLSGEDPSEKSFDFAPLRLYGTHGIQEINELIQRMVSIQMSQRPGSIQEVVDELHAIQRLQQRDQQQRIWTPPQNQATYTSQTTQQQTQYYQPSTTQQQQQQHHMPTPPKKRFSRRNMLIGSLGLGGAVLLTSVGISLLQPEQKPVQTNTLKWITWSDDLRYGLKHYGNTDMLYFLEETHQTNRRLQPFKVDDVFIASWSPNNEWLFLQNQIDKRQIIPTARETSKVPIPFLSKVNVNAKCVAWSPDSSQIAMGGWESLYIGNAKDGEELFHDEFDTEKFMITQIAWSPDGKKLALLEEYTTDQSPYLRVKLWDAEKMEMLATTGYLSEGRADKTTLAWSPDSQLIAINNTESLQVIAITQPDEVKTIAAVEATENIIEIKWSPNGQYITVVTDVQAQYKGMIRLWNVKQGKFVKTYKDSRHIDQIAWSKDSRQIRIAYHRDSSVKLWRV